jgi:hypothetical protein
MEELTNQDVSNCITPRPEFIYVNAADVGRCIGKLYLGTKKSDKKNRPKLLSSFIHLLSYIKDWDSEYSNRYIAACCDLKFTSQVSYYKKKHDNFWTNPRYRIRIQLAIESMAKIEQRKHKRFKNKTYGED